MEVIKNNKNINEFLRYLLVGGVSFIADFSVLFITKEFILRFFQYSVYISTALGFVVGLAVNYYLSLNYVFISAKGTKVGRSINDMLVFVFVGIAGLIISEIIMLLGTGILVFNYLFVKAAATAVVLLWNYLARKILIFSK